MTKKSAADRVLELEKKILESPTPTRDELVELGKGCALEAFTLARQVKALEAGRGALLKLVRREQTNSSGNEFDMLCLIEKEIMKWSQND